MDYAKMSVFGLKCEIARKLGYVSKIGYMDQASNSREQYWITPSKRKTSILPDWPTDIKAAWELLDEAETQGVGYEVVNEITSVNGTVLKTVKRVTLFDPIGGPTSDEYTASADTAPRAICIAYLKWMEAKE